MTVSFILPVYKAEKWLEKCVESIMVQKGAELEIILVDDGSPDRSGAICDQLAEKYACVHAIHQKNMGCGFARNTGMDAAHGEYICFVDSDDTIDAHLLEDTLKAAQQTKADIVAHGHHIIYERDDGSVQRVVTELPLLEGTLTYEQFAERFGQARRSNPATVWGKLFLRSYLERTGVRFTSQSVGEDAVFMLDVYTAGFDRICFLQAPYYEHVLRRGSAVDRYHKDRYQSEWNIAERLDRLLDKLNLRDTACQELAAERYVRMLTLEASNLAAKKCAMTWREKRAHLRELAQRPRVRWAVEMLPASFYGNKNQKMQLVLLKCHLYGCELMSKQLLRRRRWK